MDSDFSLRCRTAVAVLFAAAALAVSAPAFAQPSASDKETARALMSQGDKSYDAKDYAGAVKSYQAAHAIMGLPETGLWVAKSEAGAGMLVEARDAALEVTRMAVKPNEPAAFARARTEADALAKSLQPRIPALTLKLVGTPAGAKVAVKVDGADVPEAAATLPRKVNPGKHTATASAAGASDATGEVVVKEGDNATLTLTFGAATPGAAPVAAAAAGAAPPPSDKPPPASGGRSVLVPVGFIIAGVGAVGGGVMLGVAASANATFNAKSCHTTHSCLPGDAKTVNIDYGIAFGALGLAAVGATIGIIGLTRSSSPPPSTGLVVEPYVTPTGGGFVGRF